MNAHAPCIAVVDDEEAVRRASARLLLAAGFRVEVHDSGAAFLATLPRRVPDCVVLDLHMPGLDGFGVLAAMAHAGCAVPVIIMTGHDTAEDRACADSLGVRAFLRKPVDGDRLIAELDAAIGAS